jgi:WD40 repeat protein
MSFSRGGSIFAYGAPAQTFASSPTGITVWSVSKGRSTAALPLTDPDSFDAAAVDTIALSPDGTTLMVSRPAVAEAEVWDVRRRTKLKTLPNAGGTVMAFRPDGRLLVTGNAVISLPSGKMLGPGPGEQTTTIAFSWNGRHLATGDDAGRVTLWDGAARRQLGVLSGTFTGPRRGSSEATSALAFSRDGRTLAVGGADGTLQLWDVASAHLLGSALPTPGDKILSLAFSADGDTLYSAGAHILYQRYALDLQRTAETVCQRAGGGLPPAEWLTYIRQVPYQATC